ncbi:MAG: CpaF family protein, partial [Bacillota bacterium]|nr:CpaF family protein [Bacillota bacterium]
MSLLERIQEKKIHNGDQSTQDQNIGNLEGSTQKIDIRTAFREQRGKEGIKEQHKTKKVDKHHELKNILHKKILQDLKDEEVEAIIPQLEGMALEIIKEDESFRGQIDRKKVID